MKLPAHAIPLPRTSAWQDIVSDFLEMACFLKEGDQKILMTALREENILADEIRVYPCFSISGVVVVICEELFTGPVIENEKVWLFYPRRKEIRKASL